MKITRTYGWNRRDFTFDATCEHCGQVLRGISGYDDDYFLNTVMVGMKCPTCGESRESKPLDEFKYILIPRHDPNIQI